jgi:Asp-tRNA(Asn)/Glu-tRNA(Gln) amidotransferase B subunit
MSDLPAQRAAVVGPAVTVEELQAMGVTDKKAAQTIKNLDLCQKVADLKASALKHLAGDMPTAVGKVLFDLASKVKSADDTTLQLVTEFVAKGEISSPEQLNAAISLLNGGDAIDRNALVVECGVGVIVSEETITAVVDRVIAANKEGLDAKGHGFKGTIITQTRGDSGLKWASGAIVTKVIDAKMGALLGEFDPVSSCSSPCGHACFAIASV